jgi:hypothetical protein
VGGRERGREGERERGREGEREKRERKERGTNEWKRHRQIRVPNVLLTCSLMNGRETETETYGISEH